MSPMQTLISNWNKSPTNSAATVGLVRMVILLSTTTVRRHFPKSLLPLSPGRPPTALMADYVSPNAEKLLGITVEQIRKDICILGKLHPAEHEDPEKNYLEEIQVHEQQEWDSEYVHLKTEEKRWFHNIAICCEINGKKKIYPGYVRPYF